MSLDEKIRKESKINSFAISGLGGIVTGTVVSLVNIKHELSEAVMAGGKQLLYTLTVGGIATYLCRQFLSKQTNNVQKILEATVYPSLFTFTASYGMHYLTNTPEAFYSALATFSMAIPSFLVYGVYSNKNQNSRI